MSFLFKDLALVEALPGSFWYISRYLNSLISFLRHKSRFYTTSIDVFV